MFNDATIEDISNVMNDSWEAFRTYRSCSLQVRAALMRSIAKEMEALGDELIQVAMEETNLPEARLRNERGRTVFQLNSYADACEQGAWLEARIDTAVPDKTPPKPDIRKMLTGLGPVVVFGAANFPFAYSTAGGDTATALAAGCPVIVKSHPAHAKTSELVATAIHKAVASCGLPKGVFAHVHGQSFEVGRALVEHPYTKAVGFTGSLAGGKQLFDWANQRKEPIPVFAEMSSINPIFLLPGKVKEEAKQIAAMCATSVTLGAGQFCTNPGLIIGLDNSDTQTFLDALAVEINASVPAKMLHSGIYKNYVEKREAAINQQGVSVIATAAVEAGEGQAAPAIAVTNAENFLANHQLQNEVFGPYSLVVLCNNISQMTQVTKHLEGQLTATIMGNHSEIKEQPELVEAIKDICGRFIINGVPTGVEVCLSMQHGGPYPSTTDSRFSSVGADGIKRFARPIAYQNWDNELLPDELKNENPLGIWRTVNNELTRGVVN